MTQIEKICTLIIFFHRIDARGFLLPNNPSNMWELTSKSSTCSLNLIRRIVRPQIWLYLFSIINKGCLDGCVFDWIAFVWASATCFTLNSHFPRFMFDPFLVYKNSSLPPITAFKKEVLQSLHGWKFTCRLLCFCCRCFSQFLSLMQCAKISGVCKLFLGRNIDKVTCRMFEKFSWFFIFFSKLFHRAITNNDRQMRTKISCISFTYVASIQTI